jgi:regulator of PEP synthase PpsR (kinase-PPPase family)
MDPAIRQVFDSPEIELFDAFDIFLDRLASCLEAKPLMVPGFSRHIDNITMQKRVEAIHYCLEHDDGIKADEFNEADVILIGVSRAGKTPVSVYLATQMGLKAANFPLTSEYLQKFKLPDGVVKNKSRAVGLTTTPELLRDIRGERYPHSSYAKLTTCIEELQIAERILTKNHIPIVTSAGKSIEEIATQVSQELGLSKKPSNLSHSLPG